MSTEKGTTPHEPPDPALFGLPCTRCKKVRVAVSMLPAFPPPGWKLEDHVCMCFDDVVSCGRCDQPIDRCMCPTAEDC